MFHLWLPYHKVTVLNVLSSAFCTDSISSFPWHILNKTNVYKEAKLSPIFEVKIISMENMMNILCHTLCMILYYWYVPQMNPSVDALVISPLSDAIHLTSNHTEFSKTSDQFSRSNVIVPSSISLLYSIYLVDLYHLHRTILFSD